MFKRIVLFVVLAAMPAFGQVQAAPPADRAETAPQPVGTRAAAVSEEVPGYEGEVKRVITRAAALYGKAGAYQDKVVVSTVVKGEAPPGVLPENEKTTMTLAWVAPKLFALRTDEYSVVMNQEWLYEELGPFEQYTKKPVPEFFDLLDLDVTGFPPYSMNPHPVAAILGRKNLSPLRMFGQATRFTGVEKEQREGQPGHLVKGEGALPQPRPWMPARHVKFTAWFSEKDGLLHEYVTDHTPWAREVAETLDGVTVDVFKQVYVFDKLEVDGKIDPEAFAFEPKAWYNRVRRLRQPTQQEMQQALLGRPAPDFTADDLQGKEVKLSGLKGRVVLLDFWASWCGPCLMAMPSIQKVADTFEDKPVTVIGVNGDRPFEPAKIKSILAQRDVTYTQVNDTRSEIFSAYRVSPIPCMILIGKNGRVQAVRTGFSPNEAGTLIREINQLLEGKNLTEPRGDS